MNGGRADGGWRMEAGWAGGGGGLYGGDGWRMEMAGSERGRRPAEAQGDWLTTSVQTNSGLFDLFVWPFAF